jgi:hypothetical protein
MHCDILNVAYELCQLEVIIGACLTVWL